MSKSHFNSFDFPWRLEAKVNPFTPRFIIGYCRTLNEAVREAPKLKTKGRYYVVAIRPN